MHGCGCVHLTQRTPALVLIVGAYHHLDQWSDFEDPARYSALVNIIILLRSNWRRRNAATRVGNTAKVMSFRGDDLQQSWMKPLAPSHPQCSRS